MIMPSATPWSGKSSTWKSWCLWPGRRACHYVIFPTGQEVTASPESYGWIPFQETDGYVIYRDPEVELVIPANLTRRP